MNALVAALIFLGQLQLAEIRGSVVDDSDAVLPHAVVELTDPLGGVIATRQSDQNGRFVFSGIAPGRYSLSAGLAGFETVRQTILVSNALPIDIAFRLRVNAIVEVIVDEGRAPETPATIASVTAQSISQVPIRNAAKGVQEVIATLPGWSTEDNGLLHVRGVDDGFLYVVDGVPVYERLDQLSGVAPDADAIESINVMTGYVPAEFGYKAGGVIDVRMKSASQQWAGALNLDSGSEHTRAVSGLLGGPLSRRVAMSIGAAAQRSDRFLDPVHPDNLHNDGDARSFGGTAAWAHDRMIITASAGLGRSDYEVPNTDEQEEAGQDQRQTIESRFATFNWQHVWSPRVSSQVSAYGRHSSADLMGSEFDTPLFANASRTLGRSGALASAAWSAGAHVAKTGVDLQRLSLRESFLFFVTDRGDAREAGFSRAAVAFDQRRPFVFSGVANPTLFSAYLQDDWQATDAMTINGGLRVDRAALLLPRVKLSPRVGVTYRLADRTIVRGSISRFFQPPQPENLLLSSSTEARVLSPFADEGEGGADIEPESQWAFDAGVNHDVTQWVRIDATAWFRSITNAADPNVFAGTTIIFPNAVATGRAYGADLRVEVQRQRAWSGYANLTLGRVRQRGPITGGLFLEDEIEDIADGEEFIPDHDQAMVASAGLAWTHPSSRASVSFVLRHETGTPLETDEEDELRERPGAELVDFENERVRPRTVASVQTQVPIVTRGRFSMALRLTVQNMFGDRYAYNFGNPFSGTHFGAPRTASLGVRVAF